MDFLKPLRRKIKERNKRRHGAADGGEALAPETPDAAAVASPEVQPAQEEPTVPEPVSSEPEPAVEETVPPELSFRVPPRRLDEYEHFDFSDLDLADIQKLFETTARYWRTQATAPDQIYWSVMTNDLYLKELGTDERRAFLDTGRSQIDDIFEVFERYWQGTGKPDVLDYGCGVGRLAVHSAARANRVICVDFSAAHLKEAERNLADFAGTAPVPVMLKDLYDLADLPKCHLAYSLITLQHNTPPVMAHITGQLLQALNPGGIAILHIPLAVHGYAFDPAYYLEDDTSGSGLEMHILPRNNVNELAESAGCAVVGSFGKGGTGDFYSEWIVFRRPL